MKRILIFIILTMAFTVPIYAEYESIELDAASEFLDDCNADINNLETVSNIKASNIFSLIANTVKASISAPFKLFLVVAVISFISSVATTMSTKTGISGELFSIISFICIAPNIVSSLQSIFNFMSGEQTFMLTYVPAFAALTATSGNISAAVSYSSVLMYVSQVSALALSFIVKPVLSCMLVISCAQSIYPTLPNITYSIRKLITSILGVISTVFISVIGLQTAIGASGTSTTLKVGKYLVSSFVPVVGYSLSESYKTVAASINTMKSSLGAFGIVIFLVIVCAPIISTVCYKFCLSLCEFICRLSGANAQAQLIAGLIDTYSICLSVLLMYSLLFVISTGIIIFVGGGG